MQLLENKKNGISVDRADKKITGWISLRVGGLRYAG